MNGILGRKVGMTQVFDRGRARRSGHRRRGRPLRRDAGTLERDGYAAVQLAFGYKRRLNKPRLGHVRKATGERDTRPRVLREFRGGIEGAELGQRVTADMVFAKDDYVDVTATSKGKGFQGGMKRHGTSAAAPRRTASPTATARPARSAPAPRRAASSRARKWPGTWATAARPSRISRLSLSIPRTTCSWSKAPCPVRPTGPSWCAGP